MGLGTAVIASALVGAGTSYYQAEQQKKAADAQAEELKRQEEERQAEIERIARDTRPEAETLQSIQFGSDTASSTSVGSVDDFLVPLDTSKSQLSTSTSGSLGFIL